MKNKKLIYLLLPVVIAIWGIIFYRIFNTTGGDENNVVKEINAGTDKGQSSYTDTFSISANYRDPFMGKLAVGNNDQPKATTSMQKKAVEPKPQPAPTPWPALAYSGMIKNQRSSIQLAMLQVNGQSYNIKSGETVEGVQVMKIYRDSVEVIFQKEKRTIRK